MILKSVILNGYKSFRKRVELHISARTTIFVGPNDHGKTNALLAIEKLNPEKPFLLEEANDRATPGENPSISFVLELDQREANALREGVTKAMDSITLPEQKEVSVAGMITGFNELMRKTSELGKITTDLKMTGLTRELITLTTYVDGKLSPELERFSEYARSTVASEIMKLLPKVVLFKAESLRQLPDTVDLSGLEENEVMQGVFKLAGIWEHRNRLLLGNTRANEDDLREASKTLAAQIRRNWTQGHDLKFYLAYAGDRIRLTVKDRAKTVTALAERSEGFTSYFAMRMLLVARTDEAKPHGYIFMFDEPGLNLHPKGQVDLQNVFEDLARTNQIIYSTHSVFLINKNHPDRNHLIFKNEEGSNVDSKPFAGGWAKVKEHLGLYLSANFLFSDKILLAEG